MDKCSVKVVIESDLAHLPLIRQTISGICTSVVHDEKIIQEIELCINEALSNVIFHSYKNEPGHEIEIVVKLYPDEVIFEIVDSGVETPHALCKTPNTTETESESGRGLFILHELLNEVVYRRDEGKNTLFLRKRFK